jgi:hypothetical protein
MFVASKKVMIINRLKNCQNIDSVVIMEFNISENDTKKPNTYSIDFNNTGHKVFFVCLLFFFNLLSPSDNINKICISAW